MALWLCMRRSQTEAMTMETFSRRGASGEGEDWYSGVAIVHLPSFAQSVMS